MRKLGSNCRIGALLMNLNPILCNMHKHHVAAGSKLWSGQVWMLGFLEMGSPLGAALCTGIQLILSKYFQGT